jgi:TetR/AcrR family transcriptional regulator
MSDSPEDKLTVRLTRQEQKEATRARILQCALIMFAERGFEGAGIREMASEAGVNHALIGYYFGDKDGLWKAAVEFLFERQNQQLQPSPDELELPLYERTKRWLRRYVRYCAKHPEHARIMVQESIRDSERLRWAIERFIKPEHDLLRANFEGVVAEGMFPNIPFLDYIYMFTAAAQSPFMLAREIRLAHSIDVADACVIDAYADSLMVMFMRPAAVSD